MMAVTNRFNRIGGSVPSYVPQGSGGLSRTEQWKRDHPNGKYAGTVPGSGGTVKISDNGGYAGYNPSSFNAELQGMQDFSNANLRTNPLPGGPSAQDLAFLTIPPGGGSPPGGSSGGGGGGISPQTRDAYKAVWNQQFGNALALNKGFDEYEGRLNKAFDPSRINEMFDSAKTGVQSASQAGLARLGPIMQALRDRAATARTDVNQAYQAGDQRLADLEGDYRGRLQGFSGGINNVLAGFDAGGIAPSGDESLRNMFAASRLTNAGMRTNADAALADRPAVYEGLNADVTSGINRDEQGLMSRIAMQRAAGLQQNEQGLQSALASAGLQRLQAEQQRRADQERLRLELAAMGLTPPSTFTGSWSG